MNTPYEAGYDCGVNGATTENCHYKWFNTPESTSEWSRGKQSGEITSALNQFPEVKWDRYIKHGEGHIFYGWIDREDAYKDFMVIEMDKDGSYFFITSSAKYSLDFAKRINPEAETTHEDCIRIESDFPDVQNKVRI